MQVIKYDQVEQKIIEIRGQKVILDSDVAELYGVETKRINEAVKNNPDKFPTGYLLELAPQEKIEVVENFDHLQKVRFSPILPKAFTERGLYMLATILKSPQAVETTLAIIDTFARVRELNRTISQVHQLEKNSQQEKTLMEHVGDLITDLIIADDGLNIVGSETTYEMNFALFKLKKLIKKMK